MDVSIILCTWNNAGRLRKTLEAFCQCVPPVDCTWELVAVNNNSTDETASVLHSFRRRLPLRYVYQPQQGLSYARNAGMEAASGTLIVFVDDDVTPARYWLRAYWHGYGSRPEGYYFGGPVVSQFEGAPPEHEVLQLAPWSIRGLSYGEKDRMLGPGESFLAANWACPAKYLDEVGGFDTTLGLNPEQQRPSAGEEADLMRRLKAIGLVPWYLHRARLAHFVPIAKCGVQHIADRKEAIAYSMQLLGESDMTFRTVWGMPVGLYKRVLWAWGTWTWAYMRGRNWKPYYIRWRKLVGVLRGYQKPRPA